MVEETGLVNRKHLKIAKAAHGRGWVRTGKGERGERKSNRIKSK